MIINTDTSYSTTICCQPMSPAILSDSPAPGTTPSLLGLLRTRVLKSILVENKVCSKSDNGIVSSNSTTPRRIRERRASLPLFTCAHDSTGRSGSSLGVKFSSPARRLSFRRKEPLERTSSNCTYSPASSDHDENQKEDASPFSECNAISSRTLMAEVSSSANPELASQSVGTPKLNSLPLNSSALLHDDSVEDRPCMLPTTLQQPLQQRHVPQRAPLVRSSSLLNVTSDLPCLSSSSSRTPSPVESPSKPAGSRKAMLPPYPGEMPPPLVRSRSNPEGEMRKYQNANQKGCGGVQFDLEPIIHFIDIPHDDDHDMLWWNRGDLQRRQVLERYMNAEPVATPNARDYYETSAHIYHEVSCGGQIHHDVLAQLLPGLDNGLRGTEINCTDVGTRRKERSREIVRSIVNAQGKSRADRHHHPESLRFQSCRFTKNSRKIAQILAVADRMAVEMDF